MPRSLTMSAASGVSRAFSAMRSTAPRSRPRTSSSVMTTFADSSRVTAGDSGDRLAGGLLTDAAPADEPEPLTQLRARLLLRHRAPARGLDLWLLHQPFWSAATCRRFDPSEAVLSRYRSAADTSAFTEMESGDKSPHSENSSQRLVSQIQQAPGVRNHFTILAV